MLNKLKELREANEEGFTLIELLVVIVIIGILAAIALPIFLNQQKAAIQAGVKSDVKAVQTAVATYLVKKPTASLADINGDAAVTTAKGNVSDTATTVAVTGTNGWSDYVITGTNTNAGASGSYSYVYTSSTGKYTQTGN